MLEYKKEKIVFVLVLVFFTFSVASAQTPEFLNSPSASSSIPEFIKSFYDFALIVAGVLAVGVIVVGGIYYSVSGAVDKKGEGKTMILGALWGLGLLLGAYVILRTINPQLVNLGAPPLPEVGFNQCTEKIINIGGGTEIELPECGPNDWWPIDFQTGQCKCYVSKQWIIEYNQLTKEQQEEAQDPPGSNNGSVPSVNGSCFPVTKSSFWQISWNFGDRRSDGARCHAGVDIYTNGTRPGPSTVVAIAPGKVVNISYKFTTCNKPGCRKNASGGTAGKVVIDHGDYTVNYGEINANAIKVKIGDTVQAGAVLGEATVCGMLHFELYTKGTVNTSSWYPPSGKTVKQVANYCRDNYMSTKPPGLMDPTNTIKDLQSKMCGN